MAKRFLILACFLCLLFYAQAQEPWQIKAANLKVSVETFFDLPQTDVQSTIEGFSSKFVDAQLFVYSPLNRRENLWEKCPVTVFLQDSEFITDIWVFGVIPSEQKTAPAYLVLPLVSGNKLILRFRTFDRKFAELDTDAFVIASRTLPVSFKNVLVAQQDTCKQISWKIFAELCFSREDDLDVSRFGYEYNYLKYENNGKEMD